MKETLFGKTLTELQDIVAGMNEKPFVAKQIAQWLYQKHADSFQQMTNLSKTLREKLENDYSVGLVPYIQVMQSKDGTKKYLFRYSDDVFVEAVTIFDRDRKTLCISTQAGCRMNCSFCATGRQGLKRNLSSFEIMNIFRSIDEFPDISNIVYMGMGEPLDNWEETKKSIDILTSSWGYTLSPRRITVSTCGFLPHLKDLLEQTQVDVAVSLHNPIAEERKEIMPVEKAYPIEKTIELLKQYSWHGQRNLTFEYTVFDGLNNQARHVRRLCQLLNNLPCHINLIRFHTIPNTQFKGASDESMKAFQQMLASKSLRCMIRASKGEDILAACGLLSTKAQQDGNNG